MLKTYSTKFDLQENIEIGQIGKANACFVVLILNFDIGGIRSTMRDLEDRFNRKYNYPYVFLNDEPFTEEFKNFTKAMTKAKVEYGLVPKEHWSIPDFIDKELANEKIRNSQVPRGNELTYHHMCR
ncbi:25566_t:CDS:2 [Dentiscutata erythropus]|uniref:25566_t:CDS:1 n=1 Tax=Dentiscutata erythropus TaxID=1348616 RepID=A0A9N8VKB6_9GLOM|nr:25566_t:CDS:2 [Dentiscutata erythropus]